MPGVAQVPGRNGAVPKARRSEAHAEPGERNQVRLMLNGVSYVEDDTAFQSVSRVQGRKSTAQPPKYPWSFASCSPPAASPMRLHVSAGARRRTGTRVSTRPAAWE